ncbi:MAPEG family protein [Nitrosomonas sp. HPC101]|uniref:MAPEG family protein n=1 Tax=Nitrosomonas sp. HPC101 TaxID=1658667 RepID=UPI0019601737|nr:MAPEG family protein [Nitrosomonas sp. HPC101]
MGETRGRLLNHKISANLSNQFEWPLFFYVACLFLQLQATQTVVALAWIFVGGRILHSAVQIFTSNVRLRGLVFTINFLAVIGLWYFVVTASGKAVAA